MFTTNRRMASTAKASSQLLSAASTAPAQPPSKAVATAIAGKHNPPQGFAGPSPNLPQVNTPATGFVPKTAADRQASLKEALGTVSQADALRALAGRATASTATGSATAADMALLNGSINTARPAFEQGFSSIPNVGANPVSSGNPMNGFQGGAVGGLLGAAAQSGVKTLADFNTKGLIAADGNDGKKTYPGPTSAGNATTDSDGNVSEAKPTKPVAEDSFWAKLAKIFTGQTTLSGEKTERQKQLDQSMLEIPAEEHSSRGFISQTLLDQKNAAKAGKSTSQGGSGDITPVDDGGMAVVGNNGSIAVNQSSINGRNLFGQPGTPAGENVSGGNKGLNGFTNGNGAGVIDPGPDGGSPAGDPRFQQDPGAALGGNQPGAPGTPAPRTTQSSQNSSVSTTLADGVRNLTLTGTAAINGTGNGLDNLINGNGAANQLRGGAGNDTLNGRAGNDILDGGSGRDVLTGGHGADRFRFTSPGSFGTAQADRLTDFSSSQGDRIEISRGAFGLSAAATVSFQAVNSAAELNRALGSTTLLIQDMRDGSLLFNQNGAAAGAGQGGVFALMGNGAHLQASDFILLG